MPRPNPLNPEKWFVRFIPLMISKDPSEIRGTMDIGPYDTYTQASQEAIKILQGKIREIRDQKKPQE